MTPKSAYRLVQVLWFVLSTALLACASERRLSARPQDGGLPPETQAEVDAALDEADTATDEPDAPPDGPDAALQQGDAAREEADAAEAAAALPGEMRPVACDGCNGPVRLVKLSAGWEHVCALTSAGEVVCWGGSFFGQVGAEEYEACVGFAPQFERCRTRPTLVKGLPKAIDIAAGDAHTCALSEAWEVYCWGSNRGGQLGASDDDLPMCERVGLDPGRCSHKPLRVPLIEDAVAIAAGDLHSCALHQDGRVSCWGATHAVRVPGSPPDTCRFPCTRTPVVQPLPGRALTLSAGGGDNAALIDGMGPVFWNGSVIEPTPLPGVRSVHASFTRCVTTERDEVYCWGNNQFGQIGYGCGTHPCDGAPVRVEGFGPIKQFATNGVYSCVLSPAGEIRCLGQHPAVYAEIRDYCSPCARALCPACNEPRLLYAASDVEQIALGGGGICALTRAGGFWCSGANGSGQLGLDVDPTTQSATRQRCPIGFVECDSIAHNGCDTYAPSGMCPGLRGF